MTTLELADKIVSAVIAHFRYGNPEVSPADVLLQTLHENDSWFCRNPTGEEWHAEKEERYEQVELFK